MHSARAYSVWLRFLVASLSALLTLSCGRGTSPDRERSASAALAELTALAAPLPSVAARLRPTERGWAARAGATRSPGTDRDELVAQLPAEASGELRIGVGSGAALPPRGGRAGARDAALEVDQGRAIYQAALPSTDLVLTAADRSAEILFVLRDAAAPSTFRFDVALSADLVRAEPEPSGGLALVDARGDKRLRVGKAVAVDAIGTLRDATMRWSDGALTLALNTEGLVHPIVLDPVVDAIAWRLAVPELARYGHAMAYDAAHDEIVMFGGTYGYGQNGEDLATNVTWIWTSGTGWTQRFSQTRPPPRVRHSMAYDSLRNKVVLFGGEDAAAQPLDDTWEWDGAASSWTQVDSAQSPMARRSAAMAYDVDAGKVVLFGGVTGFDVLALQNDTWTWDGTAWANVTDPDKSPTPRSGHAMAYDPDAKRVVMYGGYLGVDFPSSETWAWTNAGWTLLPMPMNPLRQLQGHAMAYVPGKGIAMAGGSDELYVWLLGASDWSQADIPPGAEELSNTTMASTKDGALWFGGDRYGDLVGHSWTTTDGLTWKELPPAMPIARTGAAMAYDGTQLLLMGGYNGFADGARNDSWGWRGDGWTLLKENGAPGEPPRRDDHGLAAYDKGVLLFGGYGDQGELDDTWIWSSSVWVEQSPATKPPPRSGLALATNVGGAGVLLFGGTAEGNLRGDTWVWDGASWLELTSGLGSAPSARSGHAMAYDVARNEVVLFGGDDDTDPYSTLGDTWVWDGSEWTQALGSGPPPRAYAGMAYDSLRNKLVLSGGDPTGNSEGALYDTWEWDGSAWSEVQSTSYPPRHSHAMGYDQDRRQMVLFGGMADGGNSGETWVFDSFTVWPDGVACVDAVDCASGFCVDGVCCESACDGACKACSAAGGSTGLNGVCAPIAAGTICDDANACTLESACTDQGECTGTDKVCEPVDQCHLAGVCDPATGECSNPVCVDCPVECTGQACGDGVREGAEVCDTVDLMPVGSDVAATCLDQGQGEGTLGCKTDCSGFDVSGCACPASDKLCQYGVRTGDGPCTSVSKPDGSLCPGGECMAGECIGEPPKPPPPPGPGQGSGNGNGGNAGHGTGGASSGKAGATDDASADGACAVASPGGGAGWRGAWLAGAALSALALRRRRAS